MATTNFHYPDCIRPALTETLTAQDTCTDPGSEAKKMPIKIELPGISSSQRAVASADALASITGQKRVLIVEDDPMTLHLMSRLVARMGYNVSQARSVAEGFRVFSSLTADVVLCDIGLPDGSGYDLMAQIHACSLAVGIAMTGFDDASSLHRSEQAGFRHHLIKPIAFDRLVHLLAEATVG